MKIRKRPVPVLMVAGLFNIAGAVGLVYHSGELYDSNHSTPETIWVLLLRLLAVICGILLLRGSNWSRWLAIAWLLYHVILSSLHSVAEAITHVVLLILVSLLLYLPVSNTFFKKYNT